MEHKAADLPLAAVSVGSAASHCEHHTTAVSYLYGCMLLYQKRYIQAESSVYAAGPWDCKPWTPANSARCLL
jgi:hypothetical protein